MNSKRLLRKLRVRGVPMKILLLIQSWLYERKARVPIGGKFSKGMNIHNMVYQSTVVRPLLKNVYYAHVAMAANKIGFLEIVFVYDLN